MIDSSVLVAAFCVQHPHFDKSQALLAKLTAEHRTATTHSMAETYAAISRLPVHPRPSTQDVAMYLRSLHTRIKWLPLTQAHYKAALDRVAMLQLPGAKIYDAVILEAAIAHKAPRLYTWNLKDFLQLAHGLPIKILSPEM